MNVIHNKLCNHEPNKSLNPKCIQNKSIKTRVYKKLISMLKNFHQKFPEGIHKKRDEYVEWVRRLKRDRNQTKYELYKMYDYNYKNGKIIPIRISKNREKITKRQKMAKILLNIQSIKNIENQFNTLNSLPIQENQYQNESNINNITCNKNEFNINENIVINNTMNYENTSIQIMNKINELFKKINLKNKIVFHYDFNEFKLKIRNLKEISLRLIHMNHNYSYDNIKINERCKEKFQNYFLNDEKIEILKKSNINHPTSLFSEDEDEILYNLGIINNTFQQIYYLQYTKQDRVSAKIDMEILINLYKNVIIFISELLFDKNVINIHEITKKEFNYYLLEKFIILYLKEYIFSINKGLYNYFETDIDYIFEKCFKYLYYYNLSYNFDFLQIFLSCTNITPLSISSQKSVHGAIYSHNSNILYKELNAPIQRVLLEFVKQNIIYKIFESKTELKNIIPYVCKFIIGKDKSYLYMEKIKNGKNILEYYMDHIYHKNNNIKNQFFISLFKEIGKIVQLYQTKKFIHNDLNIRNIVIVPEGNHFTIKIIDFDHSIINYHGIFIFNLSDLITRYSNVFEKNIIHNTITNKNMIHIDINNFTKSIDLLKLSMVLFGLPDYIKLRISNFKNININNIQNTYNLSEDFINTMRLKLFNTNNTIIPHGIIKYFENKNSPIKHLKKTYRRVFIYNIYVRKYIFDQFLKEIGKNSNRNWIENNNMWINNFLPEKFIQILNSVEI
jgi:serine/threonine protein kinase